MSDGEIIRKLWSFVVPSEKPEFRRRVAVSMAFLIASKGLNVGVSLNKAVLLARWLSKTCPPRKVFCIAADPCP